MYLKSTIKAIYVHGYGNKEINFLTVKDFIGFIIVFKKNLHTYDIHNAYEVRLSFIGIKKTLDKSISDITMRFKNDIVMDFVRVYASAQIGGRRWMFYMYIYEYKKIIFLTAVPLRIVSVKKYA